MSLLFILLMIIVIVASIIAAMYFAQKKDRSWGDFMATGMFSAMANQTLDTLLNYARNGRGETKFPWYLTPSENKPKLKTQKERNITDLITYSLNARGQSFQADYKKYMKTYLLDNDLEFWDQQKFLKDLQENIHMTDDELKILTEKSDYLPVPERTKMTDYRPTYDGDDNDLSARIASIYYYLDKNQWNITEDLRWNLVEYYIGVITEDFFKQKSMDVLDVFGNVNTKNFPHFCSIYPEDTKHGSVGHFEAALTKTANGTGFKNLFIYMPNNKEIYKRVSFILSFIKDAKIFIVYHPKYEEYLTGFLNQAQKTIKLKKIQSPFNLQYKKTKRLGSFVTLTANS